MAERRRTQRRQTPGWGHAPWPVHAQQCLFMLLQVAGLAQCRQQLLPCDNAGHPVPGPAPRRAHALPHPGACKRLLQCMQPVVSLPRSMHACRLTMSASASRALSTSSAVTRASPALALACALASCCCSTWSWSRSTCAVCHGGACMYRAGAGIDGPIFGDVNMGAPSSCCEGMNHSAQGNCTASLCKSAPGCPQRACAACAAARARRWSGSQWCGRAPPPWPARYAAPEGQRQLHAAP